MYTPFRRVPGPYYAAVSPCTTITIRNLNDAAKIAAGQTGSCSICHDTLGEDDVGTNLAMTFLDCNHSFHEVCLMQWLGSIVLPSIDQVDSAFQAPSEATSSTDVVEDDLPQHITSLETQIFVQEVGAAMQSIMDRMDEVSRPDENSPADFAMRRARGLSNRLTSGSEDQIREAVREINVIGPQILDEDVALDDLEHHLEEGEIRDDNDADQSLPPVDVFSDAFPYHDPLLRMSQTTERKHHCPLCRTPVFGQEAPCHSDTLQLLRVRLRLTDLAYTFFRYERNPYEDRDRTQISELLNRRYSDNEILGQHESLPSPPECRRMFKHARHCLRVSAYRYMRMHQLPAAEQLSVIQLISFFENFELKNDNMISFFFGEKPLEIGDWTAHFPFQDQSYYKDPKSFFSRVVFESRFDGNVPKAIPVPVQQSRAQEYLEGRERLRRQLTYAQSNR
ncbi:MAG: hypothetical protein L6R41_007869 [Letrouitia leprolyta]|nr:MAG: hypothetical protein L6R41_007869 [Letrouitia leprolyta]